VYELIDDTIVHDNPADEYDPIDREIWWN
jgi:hypothetical protein